MLQTEGERQRGYVDVTCNVRMCSIFLWFMMTQPQGHHNVSSPMHHINVHFSTRYDRLSVHVDYFCQKANTLLMASMIFNYLLENCSCHLVTFNMHHVADISSPWTSANGGSIKHGPYLLTRFSSFLNINA